MSALSKRIRRNQVQYFSGGGGVITPPNPGTARLWSNPDTWVPGSTDPNDVPQADESFEISVDSVIMLDVVTPALGNIICYGKVIVPKDAQTRIDSRSFMLAGTGTIQFHDGTPGSWTNATWGWTPRGTITGSTPRMVTATTGATPVQMGQNNSGSDRSFMIEDGGQILGGPPALDHHWRLADHATIGTNFIKVRGAANVKQGDKFVIGTTDYYGQSGNSEMTVAADSTGDTITFTTNFTRFHWGKLQWVTKTAARTGRVSLVDEGWRPTTDAPFTFDQSAHVIRLNRSIVIDGSMDGALGGRFMIHGKSGTINIDGWEFAGMGVAGHQQWYGGVHHHMTSYEMPNGPNSPSNGNYVGGTLESSLCSGHFVRNCSVHHSKNRGHVPHGSNGITYDHNVFFDVVASSLFFEEGSARKCVVNENHSILTRASVAPNILQVFDSDNADEGVLARASAFWITNPDNTVTNNSAGDCITGFWNAFTNRNLDFGGGYIFKACFGLSKNIPFAPGGLSILQWDNNEAYAYRKMGVLTDFAQSDEAGNVASDGYPYTGSPADDVIQVLSRVKLWKGFRGYQNRVHRVQYKNFSGADICGAMLNGAAGAGSLALNGLGIAQSLNMTTRPSSAPTYDAVAISYNGSLAFPGWIGVGFTMQDVGYDNETGVNGAGMLTSRGFFKMWSEYLYPITVWGRRSAGIELLNSDFGFRTPPGWLTREAPYNKTDSAYFGGDLSGAMKQYDTYLGDAAVGKTWVYNVPFLTYGATGVVEALPIGKNNGVLVNETFLGVRESDEGVPRYDGIVYPLSNPKAKRDTRRLDPSTLAEVGHWIAPGGTAPDGTAIQTHGGIEFTHFAVMEGGVYKSIAPDIPQTYWFDVIIGSRAGDKSFVRGVPFTGAKTAKVAAGTNNDDMGGGSDYYATPVAVANNYARRFTEVTSGGLAALIAGPPNSFWQDKPNNYVWFKYIGGYTGYNNDPSLDTYDYSPVYVAVSAVTTP